MKIDSIHHSKNVRQKDRKSDAYIQQVSKSAYQPLQLEREYTKALNAVKMERMFAKPFVYALKYHSEGINYLVNRNDIFLSASFDNSIIKWDLYKREIIERYKYKENIRGLAYKDNLMYVGQNKSVLQGDFIYNCKNYVNHISVGKELFVSTTENLSIFDLERNYSKLKYDFGRVNFTTLNESFVYLSSACTQKHIKILDNRTGTCVTELKASASCLAFNPQKGHEFTYSSENNSYMYDLRYLDKPIGIFRGHFNEIKSISYRPDGKEIATGSLDDTIRIYSVNGRKSRDVYYNDRMQHVTGVSYSKDGKFLVSSSDDGSLRVWRSEASCKTNLSKRESDAYKHRQALIDKFKEVGEIERISNHRFLPRKVKNGMRIEHEKFVSKNRKK